MFSSLHLTRGLFGLILGRIDRLNMAVESPETRAET